MTDHTDLIRRARELAALSHGTTPGYWQTVGTSICSDAGHLIVRRASVYGETRAEGDRNARLIAAAPEMAWRLAELADTLERIERALDDLEYMAWERRRTDEELVLHEAVRVVRAAMSGQDETDD